MHGIKCKCELCKDLAGIAKRMDDWKKKYGWFYHYVFDDSSFPFNTNAHTHGFDTKYGHRNIQICLSIPPESVGGIFWAIAARLDAGVRFVPDKRYDEIIQDFDVQFAYAYSNDVIVLRLIAPDEKGDFYSEPYKQQWEGTFKNLPSNLN
jgi:hypothetical protein